MILQNPKDTFANKYDKEGIDLIEEQKKICLNLLVKRKGNKQCFGFRIICNKGLWKKRRIT